MNEDDYKFEKLTPISTVDLGIYKNALDFVFDNDDIKNVGLTGAYCAGKSSILESYKVKHPQKHFLHISLTNLESVETVDTKKQTPKIEESIIKENTLEGKILNQLIHQVKINRIPQSNFRVKRHVSKIKSFFSALGVLLLSHIIGFNAWNQFIESISVPWIKNILLWSTNTVCLLISILLMIVLLIMLIYKLILLQKNKNLFKKISVQGNEIEIFEKCDDSYFDKYLNEVLYLFENSEADVIVFEDMDRYNANQIFQKLREVNTLINNRRLKKKNTFSKKHEGLDAFFNKVFYKNKVQPLRFFYLLRDDIFVSKDRTKFFDFIIPIVPVIDSSNSYDQFIAHFKAAKLFELFDIGFLNDISLYVDEMRILKNIYNEFVIYYKKIIKIQPNPNKLLALIVYKNLFPRDFSNLQLNKGFIYNLFSHKEVFIKKEKELIAKEIAELEEQVEQIENEPLNTEKEVNIVYRNPPKGNANGPLPQFSEEYNSRKEAIKQREDGKVETIKNEIANLYQKKQDLNNEKLENILGDNIDSIFRSLEYKNEISQTNSFNEIKSNEYFPLLKYLIRNGFIDETYPDYITYFYEQSLNRIDKIYLRSVTDEDAKEYTYSLNDPEMVVSRLRPIYFDKRETLNFDLFCFLLQEQDTYPELLQRFTRQLKNNKNLDFIKQFFSSEKEKISFVSYINHEWPQLYQNIIQENSFSQIEKKDFTLASIYYSSDNDLSEMNSENLLSDYIANCSDFLHINNPDTERIIEAFELLQINFRFIDYDHSDSDLWNAVYSHDLYELNIKMINTILENHYQLSTGDDYIHKNYSLILSKPDEPLVSYVQRNMERYMEVMLEQCNGSITDEEETVTYILNDKSIPDEQKESYIDNLQTTITSLRDIADPVWWQRLIDYELLSYTDDNVLFYFFNMKEKELDEYLIFLINNNGNFHSSSEDINKEFGDNGASSFFHAVIGCNSIKNEKYESIMKSLNRYYKASPVEGINKDKVDILIKLSIIRMSTDALIFMREHYPDNLLFFIKNNIKEYVGVVEQGDYIIDEALEVLKMEVDDNYKIQLLDLTSETVSIINKSYTESVEAYILDNNFDINDLPFIIQHYENLNEKSKEVVERLAIDHISDILSHEYTASYALLFKLITSELLKPSEGLELFSISLHSYNKDQCQSCLEVLELDDYLSLFIGKRPKFKNSITTERILDAFEENGWITKYEEETSEYYRAYGRRQKKKKKNAS